MNELTFEEALRLGIEAHKAGNLQDADRYYTAILGANPNHPDANHNMGVLAVGVGKLETALPFFEKAILANPKIEQYWLSHIDALVRLKRYDKANEVFDQAQRNDVDGNSLRTCRETKEFQIELDLPRENLQEILSKYNDGRYRQAIKDARKAVEQHQMK